MKSSNSLQQALSLSPSNEAFTHESGAVTLKIHPLSALLREYRLRASFTPPVLARLTEVSLDSILGLEAGSLMIPLRDVYALCNVLNVPPSKVAAATHLKRG